MVGLSVGAVVASGGAADAAPTGNLVVNGSFESPPLASGYVVYPAGSRGITGWTVGKGSVPGSSVEQDASDVWPADTGSVSIDLSGNAPGNIYQDLATTPGTTYEVSFAIGGNFYCGQPVKTMRIAWGRTVFRTQFNDTDSSRSDMRWQHDSIEETARGSRTRLDFADATPDQSSCGATLDSVSVVAVPAPQAPEAPYAALLVVGAVGIFGAGTVVVRRRRRSRA